MKKAITILTVILVILLGFTFRQSQAFASLTNWFAPDMKFEVEIYDFDRLDSGDLAGYYFHYTNTGRSKLKIQDISTACGCTVVDWNSRPLSPGESDSLYITYDTNLLGYFTKEIVVNSNSSTSPDRIYIKGMVDRPKELK